MKKKIKFNACEHLDFDEKKYSISLAVISSGGMAKLVWERKSIDNELQLCQFCKLIGRLSSPEACLSEKYKMCNDYKEKKHIVIKEVS